MLGSRTPPPPPPSLKMAGKWEGVGVWTNPDEPPMGATCPTFLSRIFCDDGRHFCAGGAIRQCLCSHQYVVTNAVDTLGTSIWTCLLAPEMRIWNESGPSALAQPWGPASPPRKKKAGGHMGT